MDKLYFYVFCANYFVPFALYFRKIIKKSKEYQRFGDPGSVFSGHVETKILKFSPASATKVRLPGRGGREGRGGEGRGWKGKGREERRRGGEGEEGRGEGMGCFYLGPPLQNVLLRPCIMSLFGLQYKKKGCYKIIAENYVQLNFYKWNPG